MAVLDPAKLLTDKDRVDLVESHVDLFSDFGTRKDNLARDENEQDDFWFHHPVDQSWEQLRESAQLLRLFSL